MRSEDGFADGASLLVALDPGGGHVFDDAVGVAERQARGVEDRGDLLVGGACLLRHAALHDDRFHQLRTFGRGTERRCRAGTGAEVPDRQSAQHRIRVAPVRDVDETR